MAWRSSGNGAVYADRLTRRGFDLILVARNRNRLTVLAEHLKDETGRSVETIAADLAHKPDVARIEAALRSNSGITLLVNNAGVGATAPLLDSNVEKTCRRPIGRRGNLVMIDFRDE